MNWKERAGGSIPPLTMICRTLGVVDEYQPTKIEKSIHYLAGVTKVYREAVNSWYADPETYRVKARWLAELSAISHRGYCSGFYFGDPDQTTTSLDKPVRPGYRFVAKVTGLTTDGGARVLVKNKILRGDTVDVLSPGVATRVDQIEKIEDGSGMQQSVAQPGSTVVIHLSKQPRPLDLLRCPPDASTKGAP
ncbi:MAG: U32 family peptidase C-terminal domain-containing protein [Desulfosarcina sp.]